MISLLGYQLDAKCEHINILCQIVNLIVNGQNTPSLGSFPRLGKALHADLNTLFWEEKA
jgi:hypothetical protein